MPLKRLSDFEHFDWDAFSKDKIFVVTECKEWNDYKTKEHFGTDVLVGIAKDDTEYKDKDGNIAQVTNSFKELSFKVKKDVNIPVKTYVRPVNAVATRYSNKNDTHNLRNELSVKCDDIQIVKVQRKGV